MRLGDHSVARPYDKVQEVLENLSNMNNNKKNISCILIATQCLPINESPMAPQYIYGNQQTGGVGGKWSLFSGSIFFLKKHTHISIECLVLWLEMDGAVFQITAKVRLTRQKRLRLRLARMGS